MISIERQKSSCELGTNERTYKASRGTEPTDILFLKHDSRILSHCWDVLKVSTAFLTGLWVLPLLPFNTQILA